MIKVSEKDLMFLAPSKGTKETYSDKVEIFLKNRGHEIPQLSEEDRSKIKENALFYWKENKHDFLTESAWLYAYCAVLKIELDMLHLKN